MGEQSEDAGRVHRAHLWAVRAAPFFLALLGVWLVGVGTLGSRSEAQSIAAVVLGVVVAVAAATVTRADELKVSRDSVEARMTPLLALDRDEVAVVVGERREIERVEVERAGDGRITLAAVLHAAVHAGWAVGQPGDVGLSDVTDHITLTKTGIDPPAGSLHLARGDTVTVLVPALALNAPAPANLLASLAEAGLSVRPLVVPGGVQRQPRRPSLGEQEGRAGRTPPSSQ